MYAKAIDAWNASSALNHTDEMPPSDVCVVAYWTYTENGIQYGHVASPVPGRGIYSSPFNVLFGSQWFGSIQEVTDRINKISGANSQYLGWSESLSGVRLVEAINNTPEGDNNVAIIDGGDNWKGRADRTMYQMRGRHLGAGEFDPWVGQDFLHYVEAVSDNPEADTATHWQEVGQQAVADDWQGQINHYQQTVDQLNAAVTSVTQTGASTKAQLQDALKQVATLTDELKAVQTPTKPPLPVVPSEPGKTAGGFWSRLLALLGKGKK